MDVRDVPRRTVLKGGVAAGVSGLTVMTVTGPAHAFPNHADDGVVIPWLDQPDPIPPPAQNVVGHPLIWENISRLTPNSEFFTVKHYNQPALSPLDWRLDVAGLVANPRTLSLADLQAMPRRTVEFTLECSGNTGPPFFIGGIGNARWGGTSLRRLLRQARPLESGTEVVFWGEDRGEVTIRDNSGVIGAGQTGTVVPDTTGGLDLTITEQFARSMSLEQAMSEDNLLCYEMNGVPLPPDHGYPMRLIAPGWYGVANVKWLVRIEVTDGRFAGRFMARDYVSIREELRAGADGVDLHHRRPRPPQVGSRQGDPSRRPIHGHGRRMGRSHRQGRGTNRRRPLAEGEARPASLTGWLRVEILVAELGDTVAGRARDPLQGVRRGRQCPTNPRRSVHRQPANLLGEQRTDHPTRADRLTPEIWNQMSDALARASARTRAFHPSAGLRGAPGVRGGATQPITCRRMPADGVRRGRSRRGTEPGARRCVGRSHRPRGRLDGARPTMGLN